MPVSGVGENNDDQFALAFFARGGLYGCHA
jgi:hypothetical protein